MKKENQDIPNWVSGGLIALIVYIMISATNFIPLLKFLYSIQVFLGKAIFNIKPALLENFDIIPWFSFIFAPIIWFIGGALIDKIIENHKSRKSR